MLPEDESHHALRVMRIEPPTVITVFDGDGTSATCAADRVDQGRLVAHVLDRSERRRPVPEVAVYQATAKGNKVDAVIERLAGLGVAEVGVFEASRSVARWDATKVGRLSARWDMLARSAAKQSRNPFLMRAHAGISWTELLRRIAREPLAVVLWERASVPLRSALAEGVSRVALVVGPEGGFTDAEVEELADAGAPSVSLGPTILRSEEAPVVAAASVLFAYGLLG